MSATRDKSQSVAFVYSNIYQLYKKAQAAAPAAEPTKEAVVAKEATTLNSRIFRADELGGIQIKKFEPKNLEVSKETRVFPAVKADESAFDDLKGNINRLQDLHSKLRFMLTELEELVKKDKK